MTDLEEARVLAHREAIKALRHLRRTAERFFLCPLCNEHRPTEEASVCDPSIGYVCRDCALVALAMGTGMIPRPG